MTNAITNAITKDMTNAVTNTAHTIQIAITDGTRPDMLGLARYHYRAGPPATIAAIRRAHWLGRLAGVLVVSHPTLNGAWRSLAWGKRYSSGNKRADADRLNQELRCISRVIIDPRCRGVGIAAALVRDYLARPLTPATEAIAAMGRLCPFFQAAGMTAYHMGPTPASCRLTDAIHARGWRRRDLLRSENARLAVEDAVIARELHRWASESRLNPATPSLEIAAIAGARLTGTPVAYAHVHPPEATPKLPAVNTSSRSIAA